jgi:hypothetical protein
MTKQSIWWKKAKIKRSGEGKIRLTDHKTTNCKIDWIKCKILINKGLKSDEMHFVQMYSRKWHIFDPNVYDDFQEQINITTGYIYLIKCLVLILK